MSSSESTDRSEGDAGREDRGSRLRWTLAGILCTGLLVLGVAAAVSGCWGHRGFGHHGHRHEFSPERLRHHVTWMLRRADASDDQTDRIVAILEETHNAIQTQRDQHRGQHEAWLAALTGDRVDRDALEELRANGMTSLEQVSREITGALAEVAEVLTAEQRRELAEELENFHSFHRGDAREEEEETG